MKLTIELDPVADRSLFDRVMAALMDHPAPVTMEQSAPVAAAEQPTPTEAPSEDTPTETSPEEMSDQPRVYGEPGPGRKRRSKDEKAEDDEIDVLAMETDMAIRTDIPATQLLEEMREAKGDDDSTEEEKPPMTAEEFRATAIGFNKKHGKAAITILSEYASGLSKIKPEDYPEVIRRLEALGDA